MHTLYMVSGKKVNHTQYWLEMRNLNAHEYIFKRTTEFRWEIFDSLTVELLIFKYRRQNICFRYVNYSAVTVPEVTFADSKVK